MFCSPLGFAVLLQLVLPTIRLDKTAYLYGETIPIRVKTGQASGQWGYLSLESYYQGRWYEIDFDIRTTGLKEQPLILKAEEVFAYDTRTIEPVELVSNGRYRFLLKFGNDFDNLNKRYRGGIFTLKKNSKVLGKRQP